MRREETTLGAVLGSYRYRRLRRVDASAEVERASISLSGSEVMDDMVVVCLRIAIVIERMFAKRCLRGLLVTSLRAMDGVRRVTLLNQYYYFQ